MRRKRELRERKKVNNEGIKGKEGEAEKVDKREVYTHTHIHTYTHTHIHTHSLHNYIQYSPIKGESSPVIVYRKERERKKNINSDIFYRYNTKRKCTR